MRQSYLAAAEIRRSPPPGPHRSAQAVFRLRVSAERRNVHIWFFVTERSAKFMTMKMLRTAIFALLLVGMLAFASGAGADLIGIYRNPMENKGQLAQIFKLSGQRCARGGSEGAFTITIGKATKECSYRAPVLGRDLEI